MKITKHKMMGCDAEAIWATPLSGYGHTADEQPLPYIQLKGKELTPRFGGEDSNTATNAYSLPLPYGQLANKWHPLQKLFNLPRRRTNIYWRNIFHSMTRKDKMFFFSEQLKYKAMQSGFMGRSPILNFQRSFDLSESSIVVSDTILFKKSTSFNSLIIGSWSEFKKPNSLPYCEIESDLETNFRIPTNSSTGNSFLVGTRLRDVAFSAGERLETNITYSVFQ